MREVFNVCMQAVMECTDSDGRRRCEMFKELPSRKVIYLSSMPVASLLNVLCQEYPDYYQTIAVPIAISTIRKRSSGPFYKAITQYLNDWRLMFSNARTYNQEGSWVYVDAEEMEKVLEATFREKTVGSGLPGAEPAMGGSSAATGYNAATSPQDDEDIPRAPRKSRKMVQSDGSDYSGSDDE